MQGQSWGTATTTAAPTVNLLRLEEDLSAAHLRLHGAYIERLDWKEVIKRYDRPHTLFYLDPPYWETEGYGVPFEWEEYLAMAEILRNLQGKAVLSINDHPAIRECFKDFHVEEVPINYTVAGGGKAAARVELVYSSWDVSAEPAGLF